ncbi:MAG: acyl-CoA dehydrogenase family protein, partial [Burkholderiaceae bacterium]
MTTLTSAQLDIQARARALAQRQFAPTAAETDRTEAYPWENIRQLN